MFAELQAVLFEFRFRFQHTVPSFLCATGFRNDDHERVRQVLIDLGKDAIEAIGISVIEKVNIEWISR